MGRPPISSDFWGVGFMGLGVGWGSRGRVGGLSVPGVREGRGRVDARQGA
jgi:hypothetical protein